MNSKKSSSQKDHTKQYIQSMASHFRSSWDLFRYSTFGWRCHGLPLVHNVDWKYRMVFELHDRVNRGQRPMASPVTNTPCLIVGCCRAKGISRFIIGILSSLAFSVGFSRKYLLLFWTAKLVQNVRFDWEICLAIEWIL